MTSLTSHRADACADVPRVRLVLRVTVYVSSAVPVLYQLFSLHGLASREVYCAARSCAGVWVLLFACLRIWFVLRVLPESFCDLDELREWDYPVFP